MKNKINVKIHKHSSENAYLTKCIANMNEGKAEFSARDLQGYLALQNATYPAIPMRFEKSDEPGEVYNFYDHGSESPTLTLEWVEIHELITEEI